MLTESARHEFVRYGAAAAFLFAVTVAVLLIRSGIHGADHLSSRTRAHGVKTVHDIPVPPRKRVFYRVKIGDTLESIAISRRTSVSKLRTLNPGIKPNSLQIGQRVRVK